jgi:hypothetical protein
MPAPRFAAPRFAAPRAACVVLTFSLVGCQAWRPASEPLAALTASGGTTLRVSTRPSPTGVAHQYVLFSARLEGDSLVGVADEEARRVADGPWQAAPVKPGGRRVAVATADIVEVSRRDGSSNRSSRSALVLVVVAGVLFALYWGFVYVTSAAGD